MFKKVKEINKITKILEINFIKNKSHRKTKEWKNKNVIEIIIAEKNQST